MRKLILMAVLSISFGINAQSSKTVAILNLENKANVKKLTIKKVVDRITKEFSAKSEFIVFERWMIDTMLASQSNIKILECRDEQCLFAIGHLLSVDLVLSGAVSRQNSQYAISVQIVDIKNNAMAGSSEIAVRDFYEATLSKAVPELAKKIFVIIAEQEKKIADSKIVADKAQANQLSAIDKTKDSSQKKESRSVLSKPGFWIPVSAILVGGAVAGYYFLGSNNKGNPGSDEISLSDAPSHDRITP